MTAGRIAALFLLVSVTVSPTLLSGACSQQYTTYSKYGFSFTYPASFAVLEFGLDGEDASEEAGSVQVRSESGEARGFQVNWAETWIYSLELSLENAFARMEQADGVRSVDTGELTEENNGRRMLYQPYELATTDGARARGVAGAFYYPESHMLFTLATTNAALATEEEAIEDFRLYLDSFVYEPPQQASPGD